MSIDKIKKLEKKVLGHDPGRQPVDLFLLDVQQLLDARVDLAGAGFLNGAEVEVLMHEIDVLRNKPNEHEVEMELNNTLGDIEVKLKAIGIDIDLTQLMEAD